ARSAPSPTRSRRAARCSCSPPPATTTSPPTARRGRSCATRSSRSRRAGSRRCASRTFAACRRRGDGGGARSSRGARGERSAERPGHHGRRVLDLAVGEAQGPVARRREDRVALAVMLERRAAAVPLPAVGLYSDALVSEHEVGGEAGRELVVDERAREAVALAELE